MLLWVTKFLQQYHSGFRVFNYITFRAILAVLTSLLISLLIGPVMIRWLNKLHIAQNIREDGPKRHLGKYGTPTMGGALILASVAISTLLWSNLAITNIWLVLFILLAFGLVGWLDDYLKLKRNSSKGLSASAKYLYQSIFALFVAFYLFFTAEHAYQTALIFPFLKNVALPLGIFFPILSYFVIVGTSNAVNLTDGLDGLAIMPVVLLAGAFAIFAYVAGNVAHAKYLGLPYIAGAGELVVFCSALAGAGLGFLWFNTYPAQVFMGDVGALSLGAAIGCIAIIVRQELILFFMGGLFVLETVSVIIQVLSFKLTGKRVFRMAPLHHHFELLGWAEPKIIVRFWIVSLVLVLIGLASLKLR